MGDAAEDATVALACEGAGGAPVEGACIGPNALVVCATGERIECNVSYPVCAEWLGEAGAGRAGCFARNQRPCDADDPGDAERCAGSVAVRLCGDNRLASLPRQPARIRFAEDCTERWPDGVCGEPAGEPLCTSPSAPPCDPASFEVSCSPDGRARTWCEPRVGRLYLEACEPTETCRVCPTGTSRCIPNSAVPSEHVVTGPGLYDQLSCVTERTVRVSQCMWEWTARCGEDEPVCHDELDGGAECYATTVRYCDTPGQTECSDDLVYAYECSEGGHLRRNWCAGTLTLCDRATGQCYADDPFGCGTEAAPPRCLTAEVYEECIVSTESPGFFDLARQFCPGGCTDAGGTPTCNP